MSIYTPYSHDITYRYDTLLTTLNKLKPEKKYKTKQYIFSHIDLPYMYYNQKSIIHIYYNNIFNDNFLTANYFVVLTYPNTNIYKDADNDINIEECFLSLPSISPLDEKNKDLVLKCKNVFLFVGNNPNSSRYTSSYTFIGKLSDPFKDNGLFKWNINIDKLSDEVKINMNDDILDQLNKCLDDKNNHKAVRFNLSRYNKILSINLNIIDENGNKRSICMVPK